MAVALDGTAIAAGSITGGTSLTLAKTSLGSDRCAVIHLGYQPGGGLYEGVSIAYGTSGRATMQAIGKGFTDFGQSSIYTLVDPPTTSTNVVITLPTSGDARIVISSWNGVSRVPVRQRKSASNAYGGSAGSNPPTVTLTSALQSGSVGTDATFSLTQFVPFDPANFTPNQSLLNEGGAGSTNNEIQGGAQYGTGTTFSWTVPSGYPGSEWNAVAIELKQSDSAEIPAPIFTSAGTVATGTTASVTPANPAHVANDILVMLVETANQAITTAPTGYTEFPNSPQSTGTAAAIGGVRLHAYWKRATSSSETAVSVGPASSQNHIIARVLGFRGCVPTGNPFDVTAGSVQATATTNYTLPGVTTAVPNCLVAHFGAFDQDTATSVLQTWTAGSTLDSDINEIVDNFTTLGVGGGIGAAIGLKATAGATGNGSLIAISGQTGTAAFLTVAFKAVLPIKITLDKGTYSRTDRDATGSRQTTLALAKGDQTYTVRDATLAVGHKIGLATGSYTLTIRDATFVFSRKLALVLAAGSYTRTDRAASFLTAHRLVLDKGTYGLTDKAASFLTGHRALLAAGSYTRTDSAASFAFGRKVILAAGSYTRTDRAASLLFGHKLLLDKGSYARTDWAATFFVGRKVVLAATSYARTDRDASFSRTLAKIVVLEKGTYTRTDRDATFLRRTFLVLAAGSYTRTDKAATFFTAHRLLLATGSYTKTDRDATFLYGSRRTIILSGSAGFTLTYKAAIFFQGRRTPLAKGIYVRTDRDATFVRGKTVVLTAGSYPWTLKSVTVAYSRVVVLAKGAYVYDGKDATFTPRRFAVIFDSSDGGWTTESGGTSLFSSVNEVIPSDANYIQSSELPINDVAVLDIVFNGAILEPMKIAYRVYKKLSTPVQIDYVARLKQGSTTIATWTHNNVSITPTTFEQTLTSGQFAAITDPAALTLELQANAP